MLRDYPKKQISKEVTAYNQVFYPEIRSLLRRYSRDNAPSGALRLPTRRGALALLLLLLSLRVARYEKSCLGSAQSFVDTPTEPNNIRQAHEPCLWRLM